MKKLILLSTAMLFTLTVLAQKKTTYKKKGYKLIFSSNDATPDSAVQQRMINTFFETYPKLAKEYNKETEKVVYMMMDTTYKGVAATGNAHVRVSPKWMHQHPEDIDVVTHEVMHIVQNYGRSTGPGWLTEGIADYARNQFGVNNPAVKWSLREYKAGQNYTNSYRVTARFLLWIERNQKKGIVKVLDKQMRDHTYTDGVWATETGKTLDELWKDYVVNPAIN